MKNWNQQECSESTSLNWLKSEMLSHLCVIDYRVYARQASPKSFGWIFLKILLVMQRTQKNEFFLTEEKLVNKKKKKM